MKSQWVIVFGLSLALLTAIVAVFNVNTVPLNYIFGEVQISLIIIISTCILIGGFIVTLFGTYRPYKLKKEKERLELLNDELKTENASLKEKLNEAKSAYSMLKRNEDDRQQQVNMSNENLVKHESEAVNSSSVTGSDKNDIER